VVLVRWEGIRKKAPAAKTEGNRLQIVRNERFADCALERREPSCEWSKGGGQEARGTRAMDGTCRSEGGCHEEEEGAQKA